MSEQDKARPVSGEIMAGEPARREGPEQGAFLDAEFETVGASRQEAAPSFADTPPASGMDLLRRGGGTPSARAGRQRGGPIFWVCGAALVVLAFWVSGGHALVRHAAVLTPAEKREPLRIGEVASRVEIHDGRTVLFVEGRAENRGVSALPLPAIEIAVTGNDGQTTRYALGTNDAELSPGDRYNFSSRLAAPADGVKSVSVTFQED